MRRSESSPFPWKLLLAGSFVYLAIQALCVGVAAIAGSSEAREAQVVDIILRDHSWVLPLRNGAIPSKPPLYHWFASAVSLAVGGVSEFSVRFTSQLAALVCMILVSLCAYRFAGLTRTVQGPGHQTRAALVAFGVSSLTYGFYQMGCQAMVDMTFAMCVWGAFTAVMWGVPHGGNSSSNQLLSSSLKPGAKAVFWLCCCMGIVARGPLGFVLPVILVAIAAWSLIGFGRVLREFFTPSVGWFAIVIPVGWYYGAYLVGGTAFLERQILFENVKRFAGGDFVNSQPWWFYGPSVLRTTFPWGLLALVILVKELRGAKTLSYSRAQGIIRWLPLCVMAVGIILLSLSSGKRHSYLLPLLPLVALQLGVELSTLLERASGRARLRLWRTGRRIEVGLAGFALVLITAVTLVHVVQLPVHEFFVEGFQAAAPVVVRMAPVLVVCLVLALFFPQQRLRSVYMGVWCVAVAVMSTVIASGAAVKGYYKGFDAMSATWLQTIGQGEELAVLKHPKDEYFDPMLFYVRRPVRLIDIESAPFECRPRTVYATKRSWLDAHEALFPRPLIRVARIGERLQLKAGRSERAVVLFRCGEPSVGSHQVGGLLQDAGVFQMPQEAAIPSA